MRLLLAALLLFLFGPTAWAQQDPFGTPDTVRVGSCEAYPQSTFTIPIYLYNDEPLLGLTIPLRLAQGRENITCDSVIFDMARAGNCQFLSAYIDDSAKSILIGIIPSLDSAERYIEPGDGEIARIFFSYAGSPESSVDTLTTGLLPPYNSLKFIGANITPFVPEFKHGLIELEPTGVSQLDGTIPRIFEVRVYPNPSNSSINLELTLTQTENLMISIYNILGQAVYDRILSGVRGRNYFKIEGEAEWSSGVYFVRVSSTSVETTKRMTFLR